MMCLEMTPEEKQELARLPFDEEKYRKDLAAPSVVW